MREWAASGGIKIERAKENIRDLNSRITAYQDRRPYPAFLKPDNESYVEGVARWGHEFVISEREPVDPIWAAITADAIHNLHVALDYLYQRVGPAGANRQFPAIRDPQKLKAFFQGIEAGEANPTKELLRDLNVFEIRSPYLAIGDFDNADKHEGLTLVAAFVGRLNTRAATGETMRGPQNWLYLPPHREPHGRPPEPPVPLESGGIVYGYPYMTELNIDVEVSPEITFSEGGLLERESVVPTLEHFSTAVESLVAAFTDRGLLP